MARPKALFFHAFVGQARLVNYFQRLVRAAKGLSRVLPHHLVVGPAGTGKTALCRAVAREFGVGFVEMRRWHEVHVVECDANIHAVYRLTRRLPRVHGRGGTDLRPPFAAGVLAKVRPDVVVYFTDGEGPAPERAPGVPVLWCLTRGGSKPTGWGRALTLPS